MNRYKDKTLSSKDNIKGFGLDRLEAAAPKPPQGIINNKARNFTGLLVASY